VTSEQVWAALAGIADPEIPAISLVELGVVAEVAVDGDAVRVELTPTFLGCPAVELMRRRVEERVRELGGEPTVTVSTRRPWTSARISAAGRRKLRESGFAPPGAPTCPYCGSTDTRRENLFGPTACRSIRYCRRCRQPYEAFKSV